MRRFSLPLQRGRLDAMSLGNRQIVPPGSKVTFDTYDACADEVLYDERRNPIPNASGLGMSSAIAVTMHVALADGEIFDPNTDMRGVYVEAYMRSGLNDNTRLEFDLMNGTTIVLPARTFTPSVVYPLVAGRQQPRLNVSFAVGKGYSHAGYSSHPRRTFDVEVPPDTNSVAIPIPQFADRVSFDSADPLMTTMAIQQRIGLDGAIIDQALMGRTEATSVPYAPGAQSFTVLNPGLAPVTLRVSWRLCL